MNDPELSYLLQSSARPGTVGFMQLVEQRLGKRREELQSPLNPTGPDAQKAEGVGSPRSWRRTRRMRRAGRASPSRASRRPWSARTRSGPPASNR